MMSEDQGTRTGAENPTQPREGAAAAGGVAARLVGFFSSIRLAVVLLILLAAVSIIGTILAQNESGEDNIRLFTKWMWSLYDKLGLAGDPARAGYYQNLAQRQGVSLYNFAHAIGLDRLYNAWYFNLMLGLLALNLVVCSLKHWPHTWRFFSHPKTTLEGEGAAGIPLRREMPLMKGAADAPSKAAAALSARGYKALVTEAGGATHLFAQKGIWGRLGIYVTHLSVLVIFLGAWIGFRWGMKGFVNIEEGSAVTSVAARGGGEWKIPFAIRCDDFQVTYYENSRRPRDYKSKLTVIDGDREVLTKTIEVNDPLIYKGIYFYQSSYGETGKGGKLKLRIGPKGGSAGKEYDVPLDAEMELPDLGLSLAVLRFVPDFAMEGDRIYTKSNQVNNPAAAVRLTMKDGRTASTWLFKNFPDFDGLKGVELSMALLDYEGGQYTGLQVTEDPGTWVIWTGCGLMILGIFLSFFVPHRRVWVKIAPADKGGTVWVAGSTNKNRPAFEDEFEALAAAVKENLAS